MITKEAVKIKPGKLFINGKWVDSVSGKTFDTINPATEEVITSIAEGDKADINLAVTAARKAFEEGPWRKTDARDRGRILLGIMDLIEKSIHDEFVKKLSNKASSLRVGNPEDAGTQMGAQVSKEQFDKIRNTCLRVIYAGKKRLDKPR